MSLNSDIEAVLYYDDFWYVHLGFDELRIDTLGNLSDYK